MQKITENVCFYDFLDSPPKDPGIILGQPLKNLSINECQEECDEDTRCNSIRICENGCSLYDGKIFRDTPTIENYTESCYFAYKTCPGGKNIIDIESFY